MFDKLGDMMNMMKKAKEIQENLKKVKDEMEALEVIGKSSNSQVEVFIKGDFSVKKIFISPVLFDKANADLAQDLIVEAINDGLGKVKISHQSKMSEATGGIKIPGIC